MKTFIDKKDTAFGFCVAGLSPTSKEYVMATKTFTCASTIDEALERAKKVFKFDNGINRVEITGKKTNNFYYFLERIGNSIDIISCEGTTFKSKAIANVSIID